MSNMILTQTNGNLLNNNNNNNNNTTGTGTTTTTTSLPPIISTNSTTTPTLSPSTTNYNNNNNSINTTSTPTTIISTTSNNSNNHNNLNSNTNNQLTATLQLNHLITPTTATLAALPSHYHSTYKDTRWLTLEVCREYQRNKCNRSENECKFAHPPPHVEVTNGKVIACYDSLKSKCTRKEPPCKYLHPPQHLKDQLLQNGKNNLVLKQVAIAMMQQQHQQQQQQQQHIHTIHHPSAAAHVNTQAILAAAGQTQFAPYHTTHNPNQAIYNAIPASALANGAITGFQQVTSPNGQTTLVPIVATNGFHTAGLQMTPGAIYADPTLLQHVATATQPNPNGLLPPHQRTDRLTICTDFRNGNCSKSANECSYAHPPSNCPVENDILVTVCVDFIKGKCTRETCKYFHPPEHLVQQLKKQKLANNANTAAYLAAFNANQSLITTSTPAAAAVYTSFNTYHHSHQLQQQQHQHQHQLSTHTQHNQLHNHHHHHHQNYHSLHHNSQSNYNHYNRHNGLVSTQTPTHGTYVVPVAATNGYTYHTQTYTRHYNTPPLTISTPVTTTSAINGNNNNHSNNNNNNNNNSPNTAATVHSNANYINTQKTGSTVTPSTTSTTTSTSVNTTTTTTTTTTTAAVAANVAAANTNLQNHDETATLNGTQTTYQIDNNGTTYTTYPQFQIITPIYQQQQLKTTSNNTNNNVSTNNSTSNNNNNGNNNNNNNNNGNNNSNNNTTVLNSNDDAAASSSATANATANLGDVIVTTSKKRSHDATEDFLQLQQAQHIYGTQLPIKRTALADTKTGLPVYQPYTTSHHPHANTAHQIHAVNALQLQQAQQHIATIPTQFGANLAAHQQTTFPQFTMQYAYPGATATYSIPYTGNPTSVPRL